MRVCVGEEEWKQRWRRATHSFRPSRQAGSDTGTHSRTHSQKTKGRKYGPLPLVAHAGAMNDSDGMVLDVAGTLLYAMTYGSRCFPTGLAAVVCDVTAPFPGSSRAAELVARRRQMLYYSEGRRTIRTGSS